MCLYRFEDEQTHWIRCTTSIGAFRAHLDSDNGRNPIRLCFPFRRMAPQRPAARLRAGLPPSPARFPKTVMAASSASQPYAIAHSIPRKAGAVKAWTPFSAAFPERGSARTPRSPQAPPTQEKCRPARDPFHRESCMIVPKAGRGTIPNGKKG